MSRPPLDRYELGGDFELVDQRGEAFSLSHRRGRPLLLFFGFTRCAASCPTTLSKLGEVVRRLPAPAVGGAPRQRRPRARYTRGAGRVLRRLPVPPHRSDRDPGGGGGGGPGSTAPASGDRTTTAGSAHTSRTYLIDGEGVVRFLFSEQDGVDKMAGVIRRLL